MDEESDYQHRTITQTQVIDTVVEPFYEGLTAGKDDEWVKNAVASLEAQTKLPVEMIIMQVAQRLGPEAAERVRSIMGVTLDEASTEHPGLMAKLRGLLSR